MSERLGVRLREAKDSLAAWYDRLHAKWAEAEATLRELHLSKPVWASFKGESRTIERQGALFESLEIDFEHCLAFAKVSGEWRICYAVGEVGCPDDFTPRPVVDCSLEVRKLALAGLPALLEAVVAHAEEESSELEAALGAASESLASFKAR